MAPATANKRFLVARAFLDWARKKGWTPALSGDAIKDNLEPLPTSREAIEFLRPKQLRTLLEACQRHDADRFTMTREEHDGLRPIGSTPRYMPVAPFVLVALGTGMRFSEALGLRWDEVDLEAGRVNLPAARSKTKSARTVTLAESPTVLALLAAMKLQAGSATLVFPDLRRDLLENARERLVATFGAPAFSWQWLRRSCSAILTNASGIYGGASAFRSAIRSGHSVQVAQDRYAGLLDDLPRDATTLEAAARIKDAADKIVATVSGDKGAAVKVAK
jgi:integrase